MINYDLEKIRQDSYHHAENSIITLGQGAIKSAVLINGGAAVAMLAFIGNVWGKEGLTHDVVILLANSVIHYAYGVLFAAGAAGTTYVTLQVQLFGYEKWGWFMQFITIVLVGASYYYFYLATNQAYNAFIQNVN